MDNVSSMIDGSLAIGGVIVALVGAGWVLMASDSTTISDVKQHDETLRPYLKEAA